MLIGCFPSISGHVVPSPRSVVSASPQPSSVESKLPQDKVDSSMEIRQSPTNRPYLVGIIADEIDMGIPEFKNENKAIRGIAPHLFNKSLGK